MQAPTEPTWIAFSGRTRIASGPPRDVASAAKTLADADPHAAFMIFDATTSEPIELDLRGALSSVLRRLPRRSRSDAAQSPAPEAHGPRGSGRPKLGVVAREVTLLPRHWQWLSSQPGGASVALRKLVEQAQRSSREADRLREATEAAYRFMHAMAGDETGFEEAARALFAGDVAKLGQHLAKWPRDVREHTLALAQQAASPASAA